MSGKFDQHACIQAIQHVATQLGRTPSRNEYIQTGASPSASVIEKTFGTWSQAVQASGLDPHGLGRPSKEKAFSFPQADTPDLIRELIERHKQKKEIILNKYNRIMPIGDTHFPFTSKDHAKRIVERAKKTKPDVIVQVGDLWDMFAASRFPRSLNVCTPQAEYELAREESAAFWKALREASPKAECFQLMGNHDVRPLRQVLAKWPEGEYFVDKVMKDLFTFEGVKTIHDPTEELIIGDIAFIHGYLSGAPGKHRDFSQMNVVHGHTHKGGVAFRPYMGKTLWELDCGTIADPDSAAMAYRSQKKLHDLTPGVGEIDQDGPRFIPF